MLSKSRKRRVRHRVDGVRPNELLDIHRVAVAWVLDRSTRPQAALSPCAMPFEGRPARAGEQLLIALVRHLRIRNASFAIQPRQLPLLERAAGRLDCGCQ